MPMENTEAIVLKTVDFSESSLIVTLFTKDFGKIRALAKGGRRLKGPFESSLDILAEIKVTFLRKNSDALDLLTESKLIRRFQPQQAGLGGLYAGLYAAELLNGLSEDYEPNREAYETIVAALGRFRQGNQLMRTIFRYEWKMLELFGHQPSLRYCIDCGADLLKKRPGEPLRVVFGLLDGGVLCADDAPGRPETLSVNIEALRTAYRICTSEESDETWNTYPMTEPIAGEIRWLFNRIVCTVLEWKPKMHGYLSGIGSRESGIEGSD